MSSDKPLLKPVALADLGVEWVNIITGHDHTTGNADGPYFCEIHLEIHLGGKAVFDALNDVLTLRAETADALASKLIEVKAILKQELVRANRVNDSTTAMVEAIRLR